MNPDAASRELRDEIKRLLVDALDLSVSAGEIGDYDPLFDPSGGVDSIAAIEIVAELECAFEVRFSDQEIDEGFFESVASLADAVMRHRLGESLVYPSTREVGE